MICYKIAIHCVCRPKLSTETANFSTCRCPLVAKYWHQLWQKCSTLIDFMICTSLQFIVYVNYEQERWYYDFFQLLDMSLPPGGQIQKSIWLKCFWYIYFIICHKFAIHCACKLWTGMMIFRFFPLFRHIDAPWWPNTEINITEMEYPDTFHDLLQDCNSLCM